jgi:hypothetical protein
VVESEPGGWLLLPRPGSLERKISLQSLGLSEKGKPIALQLVSAAQGW